MRVPTPALALTVTSVTAPSSTPRDGAPHGAFDATYVARDDAGARRLTVHATLRPVGRAGARGPAYTP